MAGIGMDFVARTKKTPYGRQHDARRYEEGVSVFIIQQMVTVTIRGLGALGGFLNGGTLTAECLLSLRLVRSLGRNNALRTTADVAGTNARTNIAKSNDASGVRPTEMEPSI